MTVFSGDSLRCPDSAGSSVGEDEFFSASCSVEKAGFDVDDWPQDFFVLFKDDQVIEVEYKDEEGTLSIENVQVRRASGERGDLGG